MLLSKGVRHILRKHVEMALEDPGFQALERELARLVLSGLPGTRGLLALSVVWGSALEKRSCLLLLPTRPTELRSASAHFTAGSCSLQDSILVCPDVLSTFWFGVHFCQVVLGDVEHATVPELLHYERDEPQVTYQRQRRGVDQAARPTRVRRRCGFRGQALRGCSCTLCHGRPGSAVPLGAAGSAVQTRRAPPRRWRRREAAEPRVLLWSLLFK